jgi:hypothetical protein
MSRSPKATSGARARSIIVCSAYAMLTTLAIGSTYGWAYTADPDLRGVVRQRDFRADVMPVWKRVCRPANGVEILGNFAGADDFIDPVTGEICPR